MSCVRARGAYVRSDLGENPWATSFPFPFLDREVFPFPSALQGPIQLQLALSVLSSKEHLFTVLGQLPQIYPWQIIDQMS